MKKAASARRKLSAERVAPIIFCRYSTKLLRINPVVCIAQSPSRNSLTTDRLMPKLMGSITTWVD